MKLVLKNIIINTLISMIILFLGEYSIYALLQKEIEKETREHLFINRLVFMNMLKNYPDIQQYKNNIGDAIDITPITALKYQAPVYENIEENEEWENESFESQKIIFDITHQGKLYRVSITKTIDEVEGLAESIPVIILVSGLCMLVMLVVVNMIVYSRLFSPVNKLIADIEKFSIQDLVRITPVQTNTYEFRVLAHKISKMSKKMVDDYKSMKEFTENMAHEMQTPLAIINLKVEHAMQDENLSAEQAAVLSDALRSVQKLFTLNRGLILLSKIENRQFTSHQDIKISQLVHQRLDYFSDFIENRHLTYEEHYGTDIIADMDVSLSEILIDNILKNAIKHNVDNGRILVRTEGNSLKISNTGPAPTVPTEDLFNRFYSSNMNDSLGLGLSIVKKICEYYGFGISYAYQDELHTVTITFLPVSGL